jgi:hypothetical protein
MSVERNTDATILIEQNFGPQADSEGKSPKSSESKTQKPKQERKKKVPLQESVSEKYEKKNGKKVGLIVLNDSGHSGLNIIPLFVIPAKGGITNGGRLPRGLSRK